MSTSTSAPNGQQQAALLFQQLETLFPSLPEPHKGAVTYAMMVAHDPSIDETFCNQAGKVVHITANLSEKIDHPVAMRGEKGPLTWVSDLAADSQGVNTDFFKRTFTFHVTPDQMNDTISFKLVVPGKTPQDAMRWQSGSNCTVDLSKHGHIVNVNLTGVKFA